MAAINFPDSPTVNDLHSVGDRTWIWTGEAWEDYTERPNTRFISDSAPAAPLLGDQWYKSDTGQTYLYYDGFWVEQNSSTTPGPIGPEGVAGSTGTVVSETEPESLDVLWIDESEAGAEVYIPSAGTAGQALLKVSNSDYDTEWSTLTTSSISGLSVSAEELNFVDGATSNLQNQINAKAPIASPSFTGTITGNGSLINNGFLQVRYSGLFAGMNFRNDSDSSAATTNNYIDFSNNLGTADSHFIVSHNTDGSSTTTIGSTPAGARSVDRRINAITVQGGGQVQFSYQPTLFLDGNDGNWFNFTSGQVLTQFSNAFSRGGMSWNGTNGRVTVPVAGWYEISVALYTSSTNPGRMQLQQNGSAVRLWHTGGHNTTDNVHQQTWIIQAAANDYFSIVQDSFDLIAAYMGGSHSYATFKLLG